MFIHQFYDKSLAHASYAIISAGKMMVIDPMRNPQPYYDMAFQHEVDITGVIETHPHADFVSSHLEIHKQTGATIYVSKLAGANYPHQTFDEGDEIRLGDITLKAINTPGHSPDSICILLEDEGGQLTTIFTGDTLFAGDLGRPDLRENAGNITAKKEELARSLYQSTRNKLMQLPEDTVVYPAHGPGSLCGKSMSPYLQTTIGKELRENYALQLMDELQFIKLMTSDQPFMPQYFGYDVELNKNGAPDFKAAVAAVPRLSNNARLTEGVVVVDTRTERDFKSGHLKGAFNIQLNGKFETWLGSVLNTDERFYLIADSEENLNNAIARTAKIGYEKNIAGALLRPDNSTYQSPELDHSDFNANPDTYTIVDVRNWNEINEKLVFSNAVTIPLPELRQRIDSIPTEKSIVVHCAAGYRSATASSIIASQITTVPVYDLGEAISAYL
ncbi:rhodanese-like domain-containing protein [Mucilaginibacter ginkgonis]|uniref:MBL fold metallo-hydrolase n=1 Tax=Mucilaginibacter ginkgonis TaxID=2682091 RepID=A0A6I4I0J2_9SPHI|nr:rhodanese-like domain-containing protein [Mucilaginibacter ginkgonis]QQL48430.1 MBL fold metallo-hydrolase [Mucilaginibacter ginkgonis]